MEKATRWLTAGAGLGTGIAAALTLKAARRARLRELEVVPYVDLERYAGRWFEIARYPARFEKRCAKNAVAEYTITGEGRLRIVNACTTANGDIVTAHGTAKVADPDTNAKLKVKIGGLIPGGDYWILELADDYTYALVGEPSRRYVWMLSRTPSLEDHVFQTLCGRMLAHGYDPARLQPTLQD